MIFKNLLDLLGYLRREKRNFAYCQQGIYILQRNVKDFTESIGCYTNSSSVIVRT